MNEIPVTINVSVEDVLLVSELLDSDGPADVRNFASKFLDSVKSSSEQLSEVICAVNGANPYCMEKIQI